MSDTGSVRDYVVLWFGATKNVVGVGGVGASGLTSNGGNTLLKTPTHKLDGPEHLPADNDADTHALDATTDNHGLLPALSGDSGDALRGDGTWGPISGGVDAAEDGSAVVTGATEIDFRHGLDVTAPGGGVARVAVDETELDSTLVPYDHTVSGLAATTVKGAIDEVAADEAAHLADTVDAHDASAISYDHTASGMTATQVQAAIDELKTDIGSVASGAASTSIWVPVMVSNPDFVTTTGSPVYVPLVDGSGRAIMQLVPLT